MIMISTKDQLNEYLWNSSTSRETWESSIEKVVMPLTIKEAEFLSVIIDFSLKRAQEIPDKCWKRGLLPVVVNGFKLLHDAGDHYTTWLSKLKELIGHSKVLSLQDEKNQAVFEPNVFSFIGAICMIFYIERFLAGLSVRNAEYDGQVHPMENALVQLVAAADPSTVIFPLVYIGSHLMDIAVTPGQSGRSMSQVSEFMKNFFAISLVLPSSDMSISSETANEWRRILCKDDDISPRNIIFVNGIFTENCSITFTKSQGGQFIKKSSHEHICVSHLHTIATTLPLDDSNGKLSLLVKYLVWLDSYFSSSKPSCCKFGYTMALAETNIRPVLFNYIAKAVGNLKSALDTQRFYLCLEIFTDYIRLESKSQEGVSLMVQSINSDTWELLAADLASSADNFPLLTVLTDALLDNDKAPFINPASESLGMTWHPHVLSSNNSFVVAKVYLRLLEESKSKTILIRTRILDGFEANLNSSSTSLVARRQFIDFLNFLQADTCPIPSKSTLDLKLIYFDICVLAASKKKNLFKLNAMLQSYANNHGPGVKNEDMEEGEEEENEWDDTDDVACAFHLFSPSLPEIFPAYTKIQALSEQALSATSPVVKRLPSLNILLPRAILSAISLKSAEEMQELVPLFVDYWRAIGVAIPAPVFRSSLQQVFASHVLDSKDELLLHRVFVSFMFSYSWVMKEFSGEVFKSMELLTNTKFLGLVSAFRSHFENMDSQDMRVSSELQILKDIIKIIALKLSWLKIPNSVPKFNRKKPLDASQFSFFEIANFPKALLLFLCDCLSSSPEPFLDNIFQTLVAEMKLGRIATPVKEIVDANIYEVVFAAILLLVNPKATLVKDTALRAILIDHGDSNSTDSSVFSENFPKLTMSLPIIHDFLVDSQNFSRPIPQIIQEVILCTPMKKEGRKKLYANFKETLFSRIIPNKTVYKDSWFLPMLECASRGRASFVDVIIESALSTHYDFLVVKTGCFPLLFDYFDQNSEKQRVQPLIKKWMTICKDFKTSHCHWMPALEKYSNQLSPLMKSSLDQLFFDMIALHSLPADWFLQFLENSLQVQESSSNFFVSLCENLFKSDKIEGVKGKVTIRLKGAVCNIVAGYVSVLVQTLKSPATLNQFRSLLGIISSLIDIDFSSFSTLLLEDSILFCISLIYATLSVKDCKIVLNALIKLYGLLGQRSDVDPHVVDTIDQQWRLHLSIVFKHSVHPSKPTLTPLFFQLVDFLFSLTAKSPCLFTLNEMKRIASHHKLDDYSVAMISKHFPSNDFEAPLYLSIRSNTPQRTPALTELLEKYSAEPTSILNNVGSDPKGLIAREYLKSLQ